MKIYQKISVLSVIAIFCFSGTAFAECDKRTEKNYKRNTRRAEKEMKKADRVLYKSDRTLEKLGARLQKTLEKQERASQKCQNNAANIELWYGNQMARIRGIEMQNSWATGTKAITKCLLSGGLGGLFGGSDTGAERKCQRTVDKALNILSKMEGQKTKVQKTYNNRMNVATYKCEASMTKVGKIVERAADRVTEQEAELIVAGDNLVVETAEYEAKYAEWQNVCYGVAAEPEPEPEAETPVV